MSTRDISEQIEGLYGFSISTEMVSSITDRIAPEIKEWQQRPLEPVYPKAEVQRCIIHQLRNSFKYVSYKDIKAFSNDFKEVYHAINEEVALDKLYQLKDKWGKEYPFAIRSWENNWDVISPFFKFSEEVRKIIYTTNIIEGLNRQFRKVTKSKTMFPTDSSLEKMLYLASMNVIKKWTQRYKN